MVSPESVVSPESRIPNLGWNKDGSDTVTAPDWWWEDADVMIEFDLRLRADIDAAVGICVN